MKEIKKLQVFNLKLLVYPGRELNPYCRCGQLDFKSSASTSSATQVKIFFRLCRSDFIEPNFANPYERK
jgi:hypothetical protein